MLKIRLQRVGRKHDPSFRIVLTDSKNATRSGKFLEVLGAYNARFGMPSIKNERVLHWLSKGAQASDTVHNLLISAKVIEGKKINVLPKKTVPEKAVEEVAVPAAVGVAVAETPAPEAEVQAEETFAPEIPAETPAPEAEVQAGETIAPEIPAETPAPEAEVQAEETIAPEIPAETPAPTEEKSV